MPLSLIQQHPDEKEIAMINFSMLKNQCGVDVLIYLKETEEFLTAHSFVLTSRNAWFAEMMASQKDRPVKCFELPNVDSDGLLQVIR